MVNMSNSSPVDILGITSDGGGFHDSSVAWIRDGRVHFAISEERISRIKHDYSFPEGALGELFRFSELKPADFTGVAIGWMGYNPISGFFSRSPFDVPLTVLRSFVKKPLLTVKYATDNFFQKKVLGSENRLVSQGFRPSQLHYFSHHLAHASSSFRTSGFSDALSINLDCFGPDDRGRLWSGAAYECRGNNIKLLEHVPAFASMGLFYSAVSVCLGFKFGDGEGKTMGLAAYGNSSIAYDEIRAVSPIFRDGTWQGNASWSDFRLIDRPELLFATKWGRHLRELIARSSREDVAAAAQRVLEEQLMAYCDHLFRRTRLDRVVLAGGTFLNVTFNRKLAARPDIKEVFIHPFPSDGGTAVGAALELGARLNPISTNHRMSSAALGPEFSDADIREALDRVGSRVTYEKPPNVPIAVAEFVSKGHIIGWFQGRAEWGPRSLGQRSVLGDPRVSGTKIRLNALLKSRDWFMPFAPSILEEFAADYFEDSFYTPFMTFAFNVKVDKIAVVPEIVHQDGTARPHMVRKSENPLYYAMISHFNQITGVPIVLNTSFNRHGLPLVHTPREAIDHLLWGCFDLLSIGGYIVHRAVEITPVDAFARSALLDAYSDVDAFEKARPSTT